MTLPQNDQTLLLLHNPKCSKSRATLALLTERGAEFSTRLYLDDPLSRDELEDLAGRLGRPPAEFIRSGQAEYKEAALSTESSSADLFDAMVATPILMERPVVVRGARAAIGRPPESVLALLDD